MTEKGHRVTIFTSSFSHYHFHHMRRIPFPRLWLTEVIEGVDFVWIKTFPGYRQNNLRRMLNMLSFGVLAMLAGIFDRERPDIVSGVTVHPLAALAGWALARLKGARYIIEVTDLWPQSLIDLGVLSAGSPVAKGMRALERFLYQRAERIVMLWRNTAGYVESLGVSASKIVWLPHGVEPARYADMSVYTGALSKPMRVMYLGAFVHSMALENIVDAAAILKRRGRADIALELIGAGVFRDEIVQRAASLGLDNISFPAAVPKSHVARVMNGADAFIFGVRDLPLYRYGMSLNKLTDYLMGGRPIIYYGRSTYDPVSEANAGFTVPPDDPDALAGAIERLADLTEDERAEMGRNGRQWALEHHNIPRLADRLLAEIGAL